MRLLFVVVAALAVMAESKAGAQTPTIVAKEVSGWFCADGTVKSNPPAFECVYEVHDSAIIRRSVRNLATGKTEVDDTRYEVISDLASFNAEALTFQRLTSATRRSAPVLRAIGRPGTDAVEILYIGPDWVQSVKTVRDYMVIQRSVRSQ